MRQSKRKWSACGPRVVRYGVTLLPYAGHDAGPVLQVVPAKKMVRLRSTPRVVRPRSARARLLPWVILLRLYIIVAFCIRVLLEYYDST